MNGLLVVDKPSGWTSHDVVQKVRGLLREKKIGHTGTLDPLATGVLVLCVGKATKIARYLEADDKEYVAELKLGIMTDTQDSEGRVVDARPYAPPSVDEVLAALKRFQGTILQRPPSYSALKVSGVPSYRLARAGTLKQHEARPVTIQGIDLIDYSDPRIRFGVRCSKGTYVRTLCADIGEHLGMGAHLTQLVRVRSGQFRLEQALTLERLASAVSQGLTDSLMLPLSDALGQFTAVSFDEDACRRISQGRQVPFPEGVEGGAGGAPIRVLGPDGLLVAVARVRNGMLGPETVVN